MKRLLDTIIVIVAMPFWLCAAAACAVAILLTLGRPVLFRQERAGKNGKSFSIAKFRTMREGDGSDAERLTKIGRIIRATSLDELPQLFQVLSGKMALVGPRPLPVRYLPRYSAEQMRRHEVRPGITGWAQVNGRNTISWQQKFAYDVWYVDHQSLALDMKILFLTVAKVFRRSGVNSAPDETMPEFMGNAE